MNQNQNKNIIQDTFASFKIEVEMLEVIPGPRLIQYTFKPKAGTLLSKLSKFQNNLKAALSAQSITMELPVAGEEYCSIEIANPDKTIVRIGDLLQSKEYLESMEPLTINLGKGKAGQNIIFSLAKSPHLFVAGASGTGKSVWLNSVIYSFAHKYKSSDLELILIDMKGSDLTLYDGLPHLLTPVITTVTGAVKALNWAAHTMGRRQHYLKNCGYQNIADYNQAAKADGSKTIPYMVIVIDELADLMSKAKAKIEPPLDRLTAMARNVGIHLVLGTQRPDRKLVDGTIKTNVPSCICFKVPTGIDSRVIIDSTAAKDLLGDGDGFAKIPGSLDLVRFQGAYVSSLEIKNLVNIIKLENQASNFDAWASDDIFDFDSDII